MLGVICAGQATSSLMRHDRKETMESIKVVKHNKRWIFNVCDMYKVHQPDEISPYDSKTAKLFEFTFSNNHYTFISKSIHLLHALSYHQNNIAKQRNFHYC